MRRKSHVWVEYAENSKVDFLFMLYDPMFYVGCKKIFFYLEYLIQYNIVLKKTHISVEYAEN